MSENAKSDNSFKIDFDPVVECAWLPDREVKLSEWNQMLTYFVQKQISERLDAQPVYSEKFAPRQK